MFGLGLVVYVVTGNTLLWNSYHHHHHHLNYYRSIMLCVLINVTLKFETTRL